MKFCGRKYERKEKYLHFKSNLEYYFILTVTSLQKQTQTSGI